MKQAGYRLFPIPQGARRPHPAEAGSERHVPEPGFWHHATLTALLMGRQERCEMDGTEIGDQIKKAELHEAVKQALMRLLDDPQVQQKVSEILSRRIRQKPQLSPNASPADGSIF